MTTQTSTQLRFCTVGSGPAVLWIHGYTMDSSIWAELWKRLPGWRHIGVDLPGHGQSPPLVPGLTLAGLADQVAEVCAATGARRVVGLSLGSCVALQLAADHPDLVSRLSVGAPTIAGAPAEPGTAQRRRELTVLRRMAPAMSRRIPAGELLADLWMQSPPDIFRGTEAHPELRARLRSVIIRHRWEELATGALGSVAQAVHTDKDLRRITASTLVFSGDEDMPTFIANAARLARVLPDCRVEPLRAAGHLCLLERPSDVTAALAPHLA
jgi:pimeloyl-ACP methyl ester carboxylesterase